MTIQRGGRAALLLLFTSFASPVSPTTPANHAPILFPAPVAQPRDSAWTAVRATVYFPTGRPTFSGERIPVAYSRRARRYPFLAVSDDLLARYGIQDTVLIRGDQSDPYWDRSLDGIYVIKDKMNSRFRRRIDILSRPGHERDIGLWRARILSLTQLHHGKHPQSNLHYR